MSYLCQKCQKNWGSLSSFQTLSVWKTSLFNFEKLAHIIQHGLQRFIVKNIEGELTKANDLSHILKKWVCCLDTSKCCQRFLKT